jgi:A/G-specific adenine glycosylase
MDFAAIIIRWYGKNHRNLPWRNTRDPYKIWLSEVILQQTRVDQGLHYYNKFVERYPDIQSLASADEEEVLKMWQGLGYYSRARNLLKTSLEIKEKYKSRFPDSYEEILSLKGIGPYTAAAIASFAYDLPHAVVDGNVYRVLSRYFGVDLATDSTEGKKYFAGLASELIPHDQPAVYNQSIMEFGAMQCVPVNPDCPSCVLRTSCKAYSDKTVSVLPFKSKKTIVQKKWFYYFVIKHKNHYYIRKRNESSIWKNMYDFPLIEADAPLQKKKLTNTFSAQQKEELTYSFRKKTYHHQLSHRSIQAQFIIAEPVAKYKAPLEYKKVKWGNKPGVAIPRLIEIFLDESFAC